MISPKRLTRLRIDYRSDMNKLNQGGATRKSRLTAKVTRINADGAEEIVPPTERCFTINRLRSIVRGQRIAYYVGDYGIDVNKTGDPQVYTGLLKAIFKTACDLALAGRGKLSEEDIRRGGHPMKRYILTGV